MRRHINRPYSDRHGLWARSAGQSGDNQALAKSAEVDAESVEELAEEGQAFEAEIVGAIEGSARPDLGAPEEERLEKRNADDIPQRKAQAS